ncbi:hypothetical protein Glove_709g15 [Diversispora epigaea]|uniref:MICOS complex subunit MIC60 n=1 Tax=Diversispora epigaea TaxID=1348612 RepID=A0A397G4G8_9GLOM|nr:hypothetical protein Glove_709g15 [Diversispora epigaea]
MLVAIRQVPRTWTVYSRIYSKQQFNTAKRFSSNGSPANLTPIDTKKTATSESTPSEPTPSQETPEEAKSESKTNSDKKSGFRSLGKPLISITLLGGIAYGGAVYYSINNDDFQSWFTDNVYGAGTVVEYVDDLYRQGTFNKIGRSVIRWRDYAYEKISGVFEKPSTPDKSSSSDITIVPSQPKETSKEIPKETLKETPKELQEPQEEPRKPQEILADNVKKIQEEKFVTSSDPIILKLADILNELESILLSYGIKSSGDNILKQAKEELTELNNRIDLLKIEHESVLQKSLSKQMEDFNKILIEYEKYVDEHIKGKENSTKQQFELDKQNLYKQHQEQMRDELKRQAIKFNEELKNELVRQAVEMQRRWVRDVKFTVEKERAGRLARLDNINYRLKVLERLSVNNVEHLDNSLKVHQLWCALRALQNAVEKPHRTPFVDQIVALKHLSSTDEVVATVLSTIDDSVAINGIYSISDLAMRFRNLREEVRRASLVPENGGVLSHLLSIMLSKFMFRKHGLVDGNDVEATLARVQYFLNECDLDNAARELNQLKGWPKKLAEDWIKSAKEHLEVKQAIEVIEIQATLSSLSVI